MCKRMAKPPGLRYRSQHSKRFFLTILLWLIANRVLFAPEAPCAPIATKKITGGSALFCARCFCSTGGARCAGRLRASTTGAGMSFSTARRCPLSSRISSWGNALRGAAAVIIPKGWARCTCRCHPAQTTPARSRTCSTWPSRNLAAPTRGAANDQLAHESDRERQGGAGAALQHALRWPEHQPAVCWTAPAAGRANRARVSCAAARRRRRTTVTKLGVVARVPP